MKERLEDLLKREKLREEQGQCEPGYIEAKQRLFELSNENELLRKEVQQLKEKGNFSTQVPTVSLCHRTYGVVIPEISKSPVLYMSTFIFYD